MTEMMNTNIFEKSVLLSLTFGRAGDTRKADKDQLETDADKDLLTVSKKLFQCKEFDDIKQHDGFTARWVEGRSLPSFFKKGVYVVPNALAEEVAAYLEGRLRERVEKVDRFIDVYDTQTDDILARLKSQGDRNDYADKGAVYNKFRLNWQFVKIGTPDTLPAKLFEKEKEKAEKQWADASEQIQLAMRDGFCKLVGSLSERLQTGPDGKKKIFRDSAVGNLVEFLELFNARNITDDADLAALANKAKALIEGINPKDLRDDNQLRSEVQAGFREITESVSEMIGSAKTRKFKLED